VTVRDALADAESRLAAAGIDTPRVDAEWIVAHALGVSRSRLFERDVVDGAAVDTLLRRRELREPLAYVLGEWGFRRLTLTTDARALVPRPETEVVVERAVALIRNEAAPRVLDIGVGSGAIALAIADEHPGACVTGVDTSGDALALARENAERTHVQIALEERGIEAAGDGWDLVVANPPYVTAGDWHTLQEEIRDWEPRAALVGDRLHETIARTANTRWLVLEVGDRQARAVKRALIDNGYTETRISLDLSGRERVVEGRRL
jgi:release factor glutamine methyltransferase